MTTHLNRRHFTVAAGVLLAGLLSAAAVHAQPGPIGPRGPRPGLDGGPGALGLALRQLNLTESQREQIRAILQTHRDEQLAIAQRIREQRQAVAALVTADAIDEGAIRAAHDKLAAAMADGAILRARIRSEVMQVLTPEQQAKARQLRAEAEQRRQARAERLKSRLQEWRERRGPGAAGRRP